MLQVIYFSIIRGAFMRSRKNPTSKSVSNLSLKEHISEINRKTGIDIVGDVPWGTHLCQFYKTRDDLIDVLVPYFKIGLENNEFCMWITSEPLNASEATRALKKEVKNLDDFIKKGQIEILDSSEWYTKSGGFDADIVLSGWITKESWAREHGYDGLRLTGNTFWLEKKDWADFTNYEEVINHVIGNYRMLAICSYSLDKCNASEIIDVVSNHQFALIKREGTWHRIESPERKKVETALNESRTLLDTVFSSMNEAVVVLDKTGDIIDFNEAFAYFCRFKNKEECRRSITEFAKIIKSYTLDGKPQPVEEWPASRALKGEIGFNQEFLIERTDLGETWITSTSFAPLRNKNGEILGVVQTFHDITERKKSEQEKERQAQLLGQVQDGIIGADPDFRITYWNKGAVQMYGYSETEALGKTTIELLRPLYSPGEREKIIDELNRFGTSKARIRTRHRNGTEIIADVNSTRISDKNGNVTGYVVTYRDVTDNERVQAALREAEFKYRTVAENTYDFEFWIDSKGRYLYASPSCERVTGHTKEEFLNDPSLRNKLIHPDDKRLFFDHVSNEALNKNPGELEFRIIHKDGSVRWIHHVCQPLLDKKGKLIGTRGSNRDITERKKAEEQLRETRDYLESLLNYANAPIIVWDKDFKIIRFNHAFEHLTGYTSEMVMGKKLDVLFPKETKEDSLQKIRRTLSGEYWESVEIPIKQKNGQTRIALWNSANIYDQTGKKLLATIAQGLDITERKQIEAALLTSEERFRLAQRSAHIGNWDWNVVTNTLEWSEEMEHMFGLKPRTFRGTYEAFLECVHPNDRPSVDSLVRASLEKNEAYDIEYRIVRSDKKIRWIAAIGDVIRNAEGKPVRMLGIVQDVTDRKDAEASLRETRDYLENLLNYANAPIIVWNPAFEIVTFNHAFERLTGYKADEVLGQKLNILFPKDSRKESLTKITKTLAGEYWESMEIPILCKNDTIRIALWNSANIYDNTRKKLMATIAQGQDITDRKLAEMELARLASFPEKNPNPIVEVDLTGEPEYLNPAARRIIFDLEKKKFNHEFLTGVKELIPELKVKKKNQIVRQKKYKNGYYLQTITYLPEMQRVRIYSTDITERTRIEEKLQESEEKYRTIVENTTNVIMVTLPGGIISYLSPSSNEVLGYPAEELVGTNPMIFHPDDVHRVQQNFARALRGEKGLNFEYRIVTKKGETKWISHSWSPIFKNEKLESIVSVIEDISSRKEVEKKIVKLNEDLFRHSIDLTTANRELEAFSYSVSHDLRAPLRSIDGFSQALIEDYGNRLDEQGIDYLQRVRKATQRMGQLIDDMLRLSRLSRADLAFEQVDVSGLAQTVVEKLLAANPSRTLKTDIQPNLMATADKKLLEILLENLIGNAWKFTSKTKRPTLKIGDLTKDGERVFFVQDNGAGFDMAYADKLFVPFQRLHSVDEYPGTGIGLAIVSRIVHRHGGRIWAEGEVGKGATFYFTLHKKE